MYFAIATVGYDETTNPVQVAKVKEVRAEGEFETLIVDGYSAITEDGGLDWQEVVYSSAKPFSIVIEDSEYGEEEVEAAQIPIWILSWMRCSIM